MMGIEGELVITLTLRGNAVTDVAIASTRPFVATQLLAGKPVEQALALVPSLFAICGRSQGAAAQLAVAAARGEVTGTQARSAHECAVEAEMAHEYLWRALIDWPKATGAAPEAAALAAARAALAGGKAATVLRALTEHHVLGEPCDEWLDSHLPGFEIWIARGKTAAARLLADVQRDGPRHGASAVPLLPSLARPAVALALVESLQRDQHFERAPQYDGRPAETGALARLQQQPLVGALRSAFGNSTLVRLAARLTELARAAAGRPAAVPLAGQLTLGPQRGLGWVETARGLLVHVVDLADEHVRGWRIVAPTEWNFHPCGALALGLQGAHVADDNELRRRADWLIQALDPCVGHRLELRHA